MASALVGGALLGTAFSELLHAVKKTRKKISSFQPALKRLESTLEAITPRLHAITRLDQQLNLTQHHSGTGIADLIMLARDGKELVTNCRRIYPLNFVKKIQYSKRLLDLDNNLLRYFVTVLPLDQSTDIKKILVAVNQLHSKLCPTSNDSESSDKPSDEPSEIIMQVEECIQVYEDNENIRKDLWNALENEKLESVTMHFVEPRKYVSYKVKQYAEIKCNVRFEDSNCHESLQEEDEFEDLLDELVGHGQRRRFRRKVISICGLGGIGKTTLAKKLYNHDHVKCHFDAFAWVSVSQTFKTREILESVLVQLSTSSSTKKIAKMSDDELAKELNFVQQKKKCLVIVDDIWTVEDWNALKDAFPIEKIAGVILLTTRNRPMGLQVDPNCHRHECQPLSEEESWKLFQQEAFKAGHDYKVSSNMEYLAREMVRQCSGLPLAIVSIGRVLATKHSIQEWRLVHEALGMSGGSLGKAVEELVDKVKALGQKKSSFRSILKSIESRLERITPYLDDLTHLEEILIHPGVGINALVHLVREGEELVRKCSIVHPTNYLNIWKHHKLLVKFDSKLSEFFTTDLQLDQSTYARETVLLVKEVRREQTQILEEAKKRFPDYKWEGEIIEVMEDEAECPSSRERRDHQERTRGALSTKTAENKKAKQSSDGVATKCIDLEIPIRVGYETWSSLVAVEENIVSICARDLTIDRIQNHQYWKWSSKPGTSSNPDYEVAELLKVWILNVCGYFGTETLQHGIQYKVAFEVMLIDTASGWEAPVKLKLILPDGSTQQREERFKSKPRNQWLQITVGNFTMSPSMVGTVAFSLEEVTDTAEKNGILIKGAVITKAPEWHF